eukprot:gene15139-21196_t
MGGVLPPSGQNMAAGTVQRSSTQGYGLMESIIKSNRVHSVSRNCSNMDSPTTGVAQHGNGTRTGPGPIGPPTSATGAHESTGAHDSTQGDENTRALDHTGGGGSIGGGGNSTVAYGRARGDGSSRTHGDVRGDGNSTEVYGDIRGNGSSAGAYSRARADRNIWTDGNIGEDGNSTVVYGNIGGDGNERAYSRTWSDGNTRTVGNRGWEIDNRFERHTGGAQGGPSQVLTTYSEEDPLNWVWDPPQEEEGEGGPGLASASGGSWPVSPVADPVSVQLLISSTTTFEQMYELLLSLHMQPDSLLACASQCQHLARSEETDRRQRTDARKAVRLLYRILSDSAWDLSPSQCAEAIIALSHVQKYFKLSAPEPARTAPTSHRPKLSAPGLARTAPTSPRPTPSSGSEAKTKAISRHQSTQRNAKATGSQSQSLNPRLAAGGVRDDADLSAATLLLRVQGSLDSLDNELFVGLVRACGWASLSISCTETWWWAVSDALAPSRVRSLSPLQLVHLMGAVSSTKLRQAGRGAKSGMKSQVATAELAGGMRSHTATAELAGGMSSQAATAELAGGMRSQAATAELAGSMRSQVATAELAGRLASGGGAPGVARGSSGEGASREVWETSVGGAAREGGEISGGGARSEGGETSAQGAPGSGKEMSGPGTPSEKMRRSDHSPSSTPEFSLTLGSSTTSPPCAAPSSTPPKGTIPRGGSIPAPLVQLEPTELSTLLWSTTALQLPVGRDMFLELQRVSVNHMVDYFNAAAVASIVNSMSQLLQGWLLQLFLELQRPSANYMVNHFNAAD